MSQSPCSQPYSHSSPLLLSFFFGLFLPLRKKRQPNRSRWWEPQLNGEMISAVYVSPATGNGTTPINWNTEKREREKKNAFNKIYKRNNNKKIREIIKTVAAAWSRGLRSVRPRGKMMKHFQCGGLCFNFCFKQFQCPIPISGVWSALVASIITMIIVRFKGKRWKYQNVMSWLCQSMGKSGNWLQVTGRTWLVPDRRLWRSGRFA